MQRCNNRQAADSGHGFALELSPQVAASWVMPPRERCDLDIFVSASGVPVKRGGRSFIIMSRTRPQASSANVPRDSQRVSEFELESIKLQACGPSTVEVVVVALASP